MADKQVDIRKREYIAIGSVPAGINSVVGTSTTIVAGGSATFLIGVTPADIRLSLWDHLFDIFIDVNDASHIFPEGSALTAGQRNAVIMPWTSWGQSSDINNQRVYKVRILNNDSSSHTYYVRYKAYTFATVPGGA